MARDAAQRLRDLVRGLDADEELRVGLEAAATGRRMLEQIAAVREGTPSLLFPDVGEGTATEGDVAPPDGTAMPESADEPRRRRFGRLRRGASRARSGAVDEEEVTDVADERRDDDMQDEGSGDAVQPELGDDEDFPWDDEDWSGARSADDPDTTRELDLVTPTPEPPPTAATAALAEEAAAELSEADDPVDEASVDEAPVDEDVVADDGLPHDVDAAHPEPSHEVDAVGADPELPPEVDAVAADPELSPEVDAVATDRVPEDALAGDAALDDPVAEDEAVVSLEDMPEVMPDEGASPDIELATTDDEAASPALAPPPEALTGDPVDSEDGAGGDDPDQEATLEMEAVAGPDEPAVPDEPAPADAPVAADEDAELTAVDDEVVSIGDRDDDAGADSDPRELAGDAGAIDREAGELEEEGIFTHAEVIPLVRSPRIEDDEATAGLDPDLLAVSEDEPHDDTDVPGTSADDAPTDGAENPDVPDGADSPDDADDFAAFRLEDFTGTATEEYAELARAVAASDEEALELAAVSAEMPGLDTSLVGLDDVVDAGIGVTETLSTTRRSDLGLRVATAVGLLLVFFGSLLWPWAIGGLILVVLGVAALELYIVTVNAGYRPLTWAGLVGVIGALAGTWVWGVVAIPIALALTAIGATLFLALSAERRTPLLDLALTIAMMAWVGVLGAPAFEIVTASEYRWLILAIVLTTAFMDVAQYFVGRALGRRKLAPVVSPKKTIEGLVGGVFAALVVGVVFGSIEASPFDPGSGLVFGAVVAVVAPLGDLAVSVVKRALDVKDMSAILPGHGGIMDRIDAMMFVIPSAWIVFRYLDLLG